MAPSSSSLSPKNAMSLPPTSPRSTKTNNGNLFRPRPVGPASVDPAATGLNMSQSPNRSGDKAFATNSNSNSGNNNTKKSILQTILQRNLPSRKDNNSTNDATTRPPVNLLAGLNLSSLPEHFLADGEELADASFLSSSHSLSAFGSVPARPRRLWNVSDTGLRHMPLFYPPPNPRCCCYITDAPPSVVAVRIAECLRLRSVSVEYDEEAVLATAMTADRCHFTIHLWKGAVTGANKKLLNPYSTGSSNSSVGTADSHMDPFHPTLNAPNSPATHTTTSSVSTTAFSNTTAWQLQHFLPDFTQGILVECVRVRGPVLTFHRTVQAVLQAACSQDSGQDRRKPYACNVREYPRLSRIVDDKNDTTGNVSSQQRRPASKTDGNGKPSNNNNMTRNRNMGKTLAKPSNTTPAFFRDAHAEGDWSTPGSALRPTAAEIAAAASEAAKALSPTRNTVRRSLKSLEQALHLLRKDRIDAQLLGMEWIVSLTDPITVGRDVALYVALVVLGAPIFTMPSQNKDNENKQELTLGEEVVADLAEIHRDWILALIITGKLPGQEAAEAAAAAADDAYSSMPLANPNRGLMDGAPRGAPGDSGGPVDVDAPEPPKQQQHRRNAPVVGVGDEHHGGIMRSLALRALTNAMTILSQDHAAIFESVLAMQSPQLTGRPVLEALIEDVHGSSRPPAVVVGTTLASQHEAVLAIRCLRLLGKYNAAAKRRILSTSLSNAQHKLGMTPATSSSPSFSTRGGRGGTRDWQELEQSSGGVGAGAAGTNDDLLSLFERARFVGKSTHVCLEAEATAAYGTLTEDDRSC